MGRHKQFDPEKTLESAMNLFWTKGYENTSVSDVLDALQINRWSLYETYGDKQALFRSALALYRNRRRAEIQRIMTSFPDSPIEALGDFLEKSIQELTSTSDTRGCLVTNSAFELHVFDKEIQETLKEASQNIEDALCKIIMAAQTKGEVPAGKNPRLLALNILCFVNGARVLARLKDNREQFTALTSVIFRSIKE